MITRPVVYGAITGLLMYGVATIAVSTGHAQEVTVLPEHGGPITLVGCLQLEDPKNDDEFVLVRPTIGPATSVTEATCTLTGTEQAIELEGSREGDIDPSMVGRWVEITGTLEKLEKGELRELHVRSFRAVPVVAPRAAETVRTPEPTVPELAPSPAIEPQPAPPQAPTYAPAEAAPVATSGTQKQLPHTASALPLTGLIGVLALAGALALRLLGRRTLGRG